MRDHRQFWSGGFLGFEKIKSNCLNSEESKKDLENTHTPYMTTGFVC